MTSLYQLLDAVTRIDNVLFVTKSDGATAEIRSGALCTEDSPRQSGKWITLGSNDGPAHIHVNSESISRAECVREEKTAQGPSFSVRFFDDKGSRVLAAFFTGMYDESGIIIAGRLEEYERVRARFGETVTFEKNNAPP